MFRDTFVIALLLFIACSLSDPDKESEPGTVNDNNTISKAKIIGVGETSTFKLSTKSDSVYYKIIVSKEGLLRVKCSNVPSNMRMYMELQNPDGTSIAFNSSVSVGMNDSIAYTAAAGTYYLKIREYSLSNSSEKPVTLSVYIDTVDVLEPGSQFATAQSIVLDTFYYSKIMPAADTDCFMFTLSQPSILRCTIDSVTSKLRLFVELLNSSGMYKATELAGTAGSAMDFSNGLPSGTYYLRISNYDDDASDVPFKFKLSRYTLDTCEYNDELLYAKKIDSPVMCGTFNPSSDVDYFEYIKKDSGKIAITVDSLSSKLSIKVQLLSENNVTIFEKVPDYSSDNFVKLEYPVLTTGKYFIRISGRYPGDTTRHSDKKYYLSVK